VRRAGDVWLSATAVSNAWWSTQQAKDALAFNPDVVLFWFGGNVVLARRSHPSRR
jgi:hypothetical protein